MGETAAAASNNGSSNNSDFLLFVANHAGQCVSLTALLGLNAEFYMHAFFECQSKLSTYILNYEPACPCSGRFHGSITLSLLSGPPPMSLSLAICSLSLSPSTVASHFLCWLIGSEVCYSKFHPCYIHSDFAYSNSNYSVLSTHFSMTLQL